MAKDVRARKPSATSSRLVGLRLSLRTLLARFPGYIGVTWILTLFETVALAFVPLFIGFAIDGLLDQQHSALVNLSALLGALILVGVSRRLFDTRAYGTIRVELGKELAARADKASVSRTNARLGMGRELADFLEDQIPQVLGSFVQLAVALVILWTFHPVLFLSALGAGGLILLIYAAVHRRFYRLNGDLNQQVEKQVGVLSTGSGRKLGLHLAKLRKAEVRISDTEALIYGAIFIVLLGFIVFNLWFATGNVEISVGRVFSIVSYSWEFVEAAIVFPMTLQSWSRLSEITQRINRD